MASKKRAAASPKLFRVVESETPSSWGCHAGSHMSADDVEAQTDTTTVGEYTTRKEAVRAARAARDRSCHFEDWEGSNEPPFHSADMQNYDNDSEVYIHIVDLAAKAKAVESKLKKLKKGKEPKGRQQVALASGPAAFGEVKEPLPVDDSGMWARHPCRVAGGVNNPASMYPGSAKNSLAYRVQCLSDHNYAVRAFCIRGHNSAKFVTYKPKRCLSKSSTWLTPENLNHFGEDPTVVDACHLNMTEPGQGGCLLTAENLSNACGPSVVSLFVNNYQDYSRSLVHGGTADVAVFAAAIAKCQPSLQCVSLNECKIAEQTLDALAGCVNLRGLVLAASFNECKGGAGATTPSSVAAAAGGGGAAVATDAGLARVLRANKHLKWLHVDVHRGPPIFGAECWEALRSGCCPELQVLWCDAKDSKSGRIGTTLAPPVLVRSALAALRASGGLRYVMVNPDLKLKSRHGPKDRLEGEKPKPMLSFD